MKEPKFKKGDIVKHVLTGEKFLIKEVYPAVLCYLVIDSKYESRQFPEDQLL